MNWLRLVKKEKAALEERKKEAEDFSASRTNLIKLARGKSNGTYGSCWQEKPA